MGATEGPNIGVGLVCIHHVITRGLRVALEYTAKYADEGFPNEERRTGFIDYLKSLVSVLHGHHTTEDELVFPAWRDKFPGVPFDTLSGHHTTIAGNVARLKDMLGIYDADPEQIDLLKDMHKVLRDIDSLWHRHIALEEEHFSVEKLAQMFPPDEHIAMGQQFSEHTQRITGPPQMLVPFTLYNLAPDERAFMAGMMPPALSELIVSPEWKRQWQPMQPFFLS